MTDAPACLDWAVADRPFPGESISGDLAVFVPAGDFVVIAVVDGLGHGPEAAAAAALAESTITENAAVPVDALMMSCHRALAHTRGAAMTLASVDCHSGLMSWVGVGNVEAVLVRGDGDRGRVVDSAFLYAGTLGYRLPSLRFRIAELRSDDLVLIATDGIDPGFTQGVVVGNSLDRLVSRLLDRYGRAMDDALVAAARYRPSPREPGSGVDR